MNVIIFLFRNIGEESHRKPEMLVSNNCMFPIFLLEEHLEGSFEKWKLFMYWVCFFTFSSFMSISRKSDNELC